MKKYLLIMALLAITAIGANSALATSTDATSTEQTVTTATTTVSSETLASLLKEFEVLRVKIVTLLVEEMNARRLNAEGIHRLQLLLAWDRSVYPEAIITGKIGNLTEKAAVRFLNKIKKPIPARLRQITKLLEQGAGQSGQVPPGLQTAPGIQKKLGSIVLPTTTDDDTATNTGFFGKFKNLFRRR